MGSGSFNHASYRAFSASTVGKSTKEVYKERAIHASLNPFGVKVRESRDSADNPKSTPLIVGLDVTGSMGILADNIARTGLGTLFTGVLDRKPISDPHVMFMGIGDVNYDRAPLQVSQFEADNRVVEQLTQLFIEGGGGGNRFESYNLAWYFAAFHTVHDSFEKRGKRGYLFTVGDEEVSAPLAPDQIKQFIGDDVEGSMTSEQLLAAAQRVYDVYHIMIAEGNHYRIHGDAVRSSWSALLGQHAIVLEDHSKLAEVVVSAIEVAEGADAGDSAARWGSGASVIHKAVKDLPRGRKPGLLPDNRPTTGA